jgi:glycosyltransferase involved in cell wall biosynthesis
MTNKPHISVIMPVYNAAPFLSQAVESILAQTNPNFEFLIFDDGSTDGSIDILNRFAKSDSRINLHLGQHRGYSPWLNEGLKAARGDYIARMDADDIALPDRFALQVDFLRNHPEVVVVGGLVLAIDADGDPIYPWQFPMTHDEIDADILVARTGGLIHPTTMIRRRAMLDVGGYRTDFEPAEDLDLWLRLAETGKLANLPQQVLYYREHALSVSKVKQDRQWAQAQRAITEARIRRGLPPFTLAPRPVPSPRQLLRAKFWHSWGAGHHRTSRKCAWRIALDRPFAPEGWLLLARTWAAPAARRAASLLGRPRTPKKVRQTSI